MTGGLRQEPEVQRYFIDLGFIMFSKREGFLSNNIRPLSTLRTF